MTAFDSLWTDDPRRRPGRRTPAGYRRFAWSDADLTLREWFRRLRRPSAAWTSRRTATATSGRGGCRRVDRRPAGRLRHRFTPGLRARRRRVRRAARRRVRLRRDRHRARSVAWCRRFPVAVVAFSDEEGARFGVACVGSQLSTGALSADRARGLARHRRHHAGRGAHSGRAAIPSTSASTHTLTDRVGVFVELHVEQGRALDLVDAPDRGGFVDLAARPVGVHLLRCGEPRRHDAAGRPPRSDAGVRVFGALGARPRPRAHEAVATFGKVLVSPNGANAIPSRDPGLARCPRGRRGDAGRAGRRRSAPRRDGHASAGRHRPDVTAESITPIVEFPEEPRARLQRRRWPGSATSRCCPPRPATMPASCPPRCRPRCCSCATRPVSRTRPRSMPRWPTAMSGAVALADVMADWVSR